MRADQLLLQRNIASSRSQAQRLIASGVRWRVAGTIADNVAGNGAGWKTIVKNSDELPHDAQFELQDASEAQYVSRGGLKLAGALAAAKLSVAGRFCLDVGQSTGGFTDCLLQKGARRVVGVDVGSGQLHASLRDHPQVVVLENVNARHLEAVNLNAALLIAGCAHADSKNGQISLKTSGGDRSKALQAFGAHESHEARETLEVDDVDEALDSATEQPPPQFDLIVGDLSFISQTLVLPALVPFLKPGADLLMLVKPQFELQPGQVGKGGIVKDATLYVFVEQRIRSCCHDLGLSVVGWFDSPITGGDGNREFFVHAIHPTS